MAADTLDLCARTIACNGADIEPQCRALAIGAPAPLAVVRVPVSAWDPPLRVEVWRRKGGGAEEIGGDLVVVQDGWLCGGTKARVLPALLRLPRFRGVKEFVYASPPYGGAQIALGWAARALRSQGAGEEMGGPRITVFVAAVADVSAAPGGRRTAMAPYTRVAATLGAHVVLVHDTPPNRYERVVAAALAHVRSRPHRAVLLRSGLDYPEVTATITATARRVREVFGEFDECWCAAGSGTLVRGLQRSGVARRYYAVCVFGVCPDIGAATPVVVPEAVLPFEAPAPPSEIPPFPSASRYDAKVWKYAARRPGSVLYWNVM